MSNKIVFSQTDEFKKISEVVSNLLATVAVHTVSTRDWADKHCNKQWDNEHIDYMYTHMIEVGVESVTHALEHQFPDFCWTDTATRDAAHYVVSNIVDEAEKLPEHERWDYIRENIDCKEVLDDVLHIYTHNSDDYEYEGENALFSDKFGGILA